MCLVPEDIARMGVTVRKRGAIYVGERDSLVTKCPSKFTDKPSSKT